MKIRKSSINDVPPERIIIGVAGGSAAGKTTLCENINRQMAFDRNFKVEIISLDSFYKKNPHIKGIDKNVVDVAEYNFDHPLALDFDAAYEVLKVLKYTNDPVPVPQYSFVEHQRLPDPVFVKPANIILFEGLMVFHDERIRNMMTYKIFINCDDDIRLCRRLRRDTTQRGRTVVSVLIQYNKFVKKAYRDFIYPTLNYADLVIPGHRNNRISVDFIVQHIKSMAKKINLFEKAHKTKTFLFGQNQYYDKDIKNNYGTLVSHIEESFLIFPTSQEHRKELEFFLNSLISETFSREQFSEIYIYQFMKVSRSLLRNCFQLRGFKNNQIEILSIYDCVGKIDKKSEKRVKVIFAPVIFGEDNFLTELKAKCHPQNKIIILNFFCDMRYPKKIYQKQISEIIFLNLFIIPNNVRFREILNSNNIHLNESADSSWLIHDDELISKALKFASSELEIFYDTDLKNLYIEAVSQCVEAKSSPYTYKLEENFKYDEMLEQIPVLAQEHENLCGFHALHNIQVEGENLKSIDSFLEVYRKISLMIKSQGRTYEQSLKYVPFGPLQRSQVEKVISDSLFSNEEIGVLYLSQNYITNTKQENDALHHSLTLLKANHIKKLHILFGCYDHYFVLCLTSNKIYFLDSLNTPLNQIMSGEYTNSELKTQDKNRMRDIKKCIQIAVSLLTKDTDVYLIGAELRIDEIIGSYNEYASEGKQEEWAKNEYPPPVVKNDLIKKLTEYILRNLSQGYKDKLKAWLRDEFVQKNIYEDWEKLLSRIEQ